MSFVSVTASTDRLESAISRFLRDAVPEVVDVVVRKTAFDVVALTTRGLNGVDGLPKRIDTGRYRAGWRVALEATGISSAGINAPDAASSKPSDGSGSFKAGPLLVKAIVTNNVEYARYVEDGTSRMAPGHHLKRALHLASDVFEDGLKRGVRAEFG